MKPLTLTTVLGLAALLAACGQKAETNTVTANTTAETARDMGTMAMPAESPATSAKSSGTVTVIDKAAGTITIDHGPIPEANWPAMTMPFQVKPELLDGLNVGDKVAFDLVLKNGSGAVTAIRKQ